MARTRSPLLRRSLGVRNLKRSLLTACTSALLGGSWPSATRADPLEALTLAWTAPPECPKRAAVWNRLRARVDPELPALRSWHARAHVTRTAKYYRLELELRTDSSEAARRSLRVTSCNAAVEAAAVLIALALEPQPPTAAGTEPSVPDSSAAGGEAAPNADPAGPAAASRAAQAGAEPSSPAPAQPAAPSSSAAPEAAAARGQSGPSAGSEAEPAAAQIRTPAQPARPATPPPRPAADEPEPSREQAPSAPPQPPAPEVDEPPAVIRSRVGLVFELALGLRVDAGMLPQSGAFGFRPRLSLQFGRLRAAAELTLWFPADQRARKYPVTLRGRAALGAASLGIELVPLPFSLAPSAVLEYGELTVQTLGIRSPDRRDVSWAAAGLQLRAGYRLPAGFDLGADATGLVPFARPRWLLREPRVVLFEASAVVFRISVELGYVFD